MPDSGENDSERSTPAVYVDGKGKLHLAKPAQPGRLTGSRIDGSYRVEKSEGRLAGPTIHPVTPVPAATPMPAVEPVSAITPVEAVAPVPAAGPVPSSSPTETRALDAIPEYSPPAPVGPPGRRLPSEVTRAGQSPRDHASSPSPRQRGGRDRHRLRKHFGGWLRSLPDPARVIADTFGIPLKSEVDPRSDLPAIFDQGQLGSCTANAAAAAFEYDAKLDGNLTGPLSRLWIYYQERKLEGSLGDGDAGARGFDAFRVASHIGVPAERYWPYDIATYQGPPPERAVRDEGFYRLTKRYATPLPTKHSFKQVFSNRQTIAFGFLVYESFESSSVAKSGIVPMPKHGEEVLGGHEVLAVGYLKSEPDYVLCRNSWGSRKTDGHRWGIDGSGYFLMPWKMILNPEISGDWTTIIRPLRRY